MVMSVYSWKTAGQHKKCVRQEGWFTRPVDQPVLQPVIIQTQSFAHSNVLKVRLQAHINVQYTQGCTYELQFHVIGTYSYALARQ